MTVLRSANRALHHGLGHLAARTRTSPGASS